MGSAAAKVHARKRARRADGASPNPQFASPAALIRHVRPDVQPRFAGLPMRADNKNSRTPVVFVRGAHRHDAATAYPDHRSPSPDHQPVEQPPPHTDQTSDRGDRRESQLRQCLRNLCSSSQYEPVRVESVVARDRRHPWCTWAKFSKRGAAKGDRQRHIPAGSAAPQRSEPRQVSCFAATEHHAQCAPGLALRAVGVI